MAEITGISWADMTFNAWLGCTKVSPACDNCYAEVLCVNRLGVEWGAKAERRRTAASTWKHPLRWNRKAARLGVRYRVFCSSLADVFDNAVPTEWRDDLWALIRATPHLDWMLLTKRPQNIAKMLPPDWGDGYPNVWLGTTVENQREAQRRIIPLISIPAALHFLSCEPLLGRLELRKIEIDVAPAGCTKDDLWALDALEGRVAPIIRTGPDDWDLDGGGRQLARIRLVIGGGESGPNWRPISYDDVRQLRDDCADTGTVFHFKQWAARDPRPLGRLVDGRMHDDMPVSPAAVAA